MHPTVIKWLARFFVAAILITTIVAAYNVSHE